LFVTLLRTPAADQYSSPGTFELLSSRRLGSEGSEISVEADLSGYVRKFTTKDGQDVLTADHVLRVA